MKELFPIFRQMTDMVVDYTFEPFWVPDIHLRSQEHPPKSGRVSDFHPKSQGPSPKSGNVTNFVVTFLYVSLSFGVLAIFFKYHFCNC